MDAENLPKILRAKKVSDKVVEGFMDAQHALQTCWVNGCGVLTLGLERQIERLLARRDPRSDMRIVRDLVEKACMQMSLDLHFHHVLTVNRHAK